MRPFVSGSRRRSIGIATLRKYQPPALVFARPLQRALVPAQLPTPLGHDCGALPRRVSSGSMAENLTRQILAEHLVEGELTPGTPIALQGRPDPDRGRDRDDGAMQFELLGEPRVQVEPRSSVRRPQRPPDRRQEPRGPPLPAVVLPRGTGCSSRAPATGSPTTCTSSASPGRASCSSAPTPTRPRPARSGMIAIGAGGLEVAVAMAGHAFELPCPRVVGVELEGALPRPWVQAKDVILELLRRHGVRGGARRVFEFSGDGRGDAPRHRARHDLQHGRRARRHRRPSSRPTRDAAWLDAQEREDDFARAGRGPRLRVRRASSGSTSARSSRWSRCRRRPATSCRSRRSPGRRSSRCASARSVNSSYEDLATVAAACCAADGRCVRERCIRTVTPGSRQILDTIARVGRLRRPVRWRARACSSRCAGRASAWGRRRRPDAVSLRTFNRNFPGRSGTVGRRGVPLLAGDGRGRELARRDHRPAELGDPPELLRDARRASPTSTTSTSSPRARGARPSDRDRARPEHRAAARAAPLPDELERASADRRAGRHLDRRHGPGRGDRDVATVEHARDRRVHVPAPRPGVPASARRSGAAGFIVGGHNYGQGSSPRARRAGAAAPRRARGDREVASRASTGATSSRRGSCR